MENDSITRPMPLDHVRRLVPILVSIAILTAIYWRLDTRALLVIFRDCELSWLLPGFLLFLPPVVLAAARLRALAPEEARIGYGDAQRLVLAANSLNMVLPSKMGDFIKAWFIARRGHVDGPLSFSLVVYEKMCDFLGLLVWGAIGLALYPNKGYWTVLGLLAVITVILAGLVLLSSRRAASVCLGVLTVVIPRRWATSAARLSDSWEIMQRYISRNRVKSFWVGALSLMNSFMHLFQIWFFVLALQTDLSMLVYLSVMPIAILAGLVPFTFAGDGTRDAALILLFAPWLSVETSAALGLLCTARYLIPALFGLPFLRNYLRTIRPLNADAAIGTDRIP